MSNDLVSTATLLRGALERIERQLSHVNERAAEDNRRPSLREHHSLVHLQEDTSRESQSPSQGRPRESTARTELRRIFYEPDVSQRHPPQQRRKRRSKSNDAKLNSTWKKDTVCLRFKKQCKGPDMQEKMILAKAGLGLKELKFTSDGDALHIHYVITDAFKQLERAGGYTLLRLANNSTKLLEIEPPKAGMNVKYLKDILKSAKLFVRPLQEDINIDEKDVDSGSEVLQSLAIITTVAS